MVTTTVQPDQWIDLPAHAGFPETVHYFDAQSLLAVRAADATGRPLLVRGEPGTGKTQLARAAAIAVDALLIPTVLDGRTEIEDLFWRFDAVRRLADAQVLGGLGATREEANEQLEESRYLIPEAFWWTFDWESATRQAELARTTAPVDSGDSPQVPRRALLIDEIDKADESVPNGLLAALSAGSFAVRGREDVRWDPVKPPLIVITTNEERPLPDAFLRRCFVLHLALPDDPKELEEWLTKRGARHVPEAEESVLREAAKLVIKDREVMRQRGHNPPGQAEYLDLVRAAVSLFPERERLAKLESLRDFALCKHESRTNLY